MGIERLDDNGNSILRLPRSGFSFSGRDDRRHGDKRRLASTVARGRPFASDPRRKKAFHCALRASARFGRVMAGPFVGPFTREKPRVARPIRRTRKILGVLSIHYGCNVSPYAISLFPFLPFFPYQFCFLEDRKCISLSLPPEGSPKILSWRKRKRAYSGNGKCFFRSAEQSERWSWEGTRLKSVAAQQRDFSFPRSSAPLRTPCDRSPFPQACIRDAGSSPLNPSCINTVSNK